MLQLPQGSLDNNKVTELSKSAFLSKFPPGLEKCFVQWGDNMRHSRVIALILFSILLGACAAPASRDNMDISAAERSAYKADQYLSGKVSVGSVIGGQDTNPAWTSEIGNEDFEAALRSSLETAYLLGGRTGSDYILDAELVEIDQPMFGFTFTVTSKIRNSVSRTPGVLKLGLAV